MKITILLLSTVLLCSCQEYFDRQAKNDKKIVSMGETLDQKDFRLFNEEELSIADHICSSLRDKRNSIFNTYDFWGQTLQFRLQQNECHSSKSYASQINLQVADNLHFVSSKDYPFSLIQTDEEGFMSNICAQKEEGVFEIKNTIITNFNEVTQIRFSKKNHFYKFFVLIAKRTNGSKYRVQEVYEFFVIGAQNSDKLPIGFIPTINYHNQCTNNSSAKISSEFQRIIKD